METSVRSSITDYILVLDLDETLLSTKESPISTVDKLKLRDNSTIRSRLYIKSIRIKDTEQTQTLYEFWGVTRPHLAEFIDFADTYFRAVLVWTAGVYPYAKEMVKEIFKGHRLPKIFFSRKDCDKMSGTYVKALSTIEKKYPHLLKSKIFIVDDRKISFQEAPKNGVLIPAYNPAENLSALLVDDPALLQLKYWFLSENVMNAEYVDKTDKSQIFKYSAAHWTKLNPQVITLRYEFEETKDREHENLIENPYY